MRILAMALSGVGMHYLTSSLLLGWAGFGLTPGSRRSHLTPAARWLRQAGLDQVSSRQFFGATVVAATAGAIAAAVIFGAVLPAVVAAVCAGFLPLLSHRQRRATRRARAQRAWPAMIEEIRVLTGSVGMSTPQALFEVGLRSPPELRWAFEAAEREWRLGTDFESATGRLKADLADPTADVVLETMLVAHGLGSVGLGPRLGALAEDRTKELDGRREAQARQAGARFARLFVLLVPLGMTMAGLSLGSGRQAYGDATGQVLVAVALGLIAGCWLWASHLLRLPSTRRVFDQ